MVIPNWLSILGKTSGNMSLLMDSAYLYLMEPGSISVSEAALKNLPMVLIDAVAGCEEPVYGFLFGIHMVEEEEPIVFSIEDHGLVY